MLSSSSYRLFLLGYGFFYVIQDGIFFSFSLVVVVLQTMIIRTMTVGSLSP